MVTAQYTTIRIKKENAEKLAEEGKKNETYDQILSRYFGKRKEVS